MRKLVYLVALHKRTTYTGYDYDCDTFWLFSVSPDLIVPPNLVCQDKSKVAYKPLRTCFKLGHCRNGSSTTDMKIKPLHETL